jgi:hypothetical protein
LSSLPFSRARALLIGVGTHHTEAGLPDVASAAQSARDLASMLVRACKLEPGKITVLIDPIDPKQLGDAIADATEMADDILLIYYVGHGLVNQNGDLYLATSGTDRRLNRLGHTAFPYPTIRSYVSECGASSKIVMLDCCFSGRAINALGGVDDGRLAVVDIAGAYVLASAGGEEVAFAPAGRPHTAFSGELIKLLAEGDPTGPSVLTLDHVYGYLDRTLVAGNFPRPRRAATGGISELGVAFNPASGSRHGPANQVLVVPAPAILIGNPRLTSTPRAKEPRTQDVRDSEVDGLQVGNLEIRAVSIRGDEHRFYGEARQDAFDIWVVPRAGSSDDYAVVASVADGIGSQPNSHIGAQAACRFLRQELLERIPELLDPAYKASLSSNSRES